MHLSSYDIIFSKKMKSLNSSSSLKKRRVVLSIFSLFCLIFLPSGQIKSLNSFPRKFLNPIPISGNDEFKQRLVQILSYQNQNYNQPSEIKIRKDLNGQFWILQLGGKNTIALHCLNFELNKFFKIESLSPSAHSFDFTFDSFNEPWVVWVESETVDKLWLFSLALNKTILIDSGPAFSLTSPSISIDLNGTIWIFWAKSVRGLDRIFFTRLSGLSLTFPESLFDNLDFPSIMPSSAVDASGQIWLTWSSYNGQNYEIFVSAFIGHGWSRPHKISSSPNAHLLPRFYQTSNNDLALVWLEEGRQIWWTKKRGQEWLKPEPLWSDFELIKNYEIINKDNELILCLKKGEGYYLPFLDKKRSIGRKQEKGNSGWPYWALFLSLNRNDDAYIAFGDSITNGLIKTSIDPEKYYYSGYPSRLETKLITEYGVGQVFNEGFDGELTAQGVSRLPIVLDDYNARYLLLMEGFNDVIFANISIDTIIFNLQTMISQSFQRGVFPLLATITPRRDEVWYQPFYRQRHLILNERIRLLATTLKIPLVDQYVAMENYPPSDGGLLSLLSVDLKHPNEKGYQVIAETWFKEIRAFPFPPCHLKVVRRDFVWEAKFIRFLTLPEFSFSQMQTGLGNFISWEINPKIKDYKSISGYRLYRKRAGESDTAYALIATINDNLHYFDKNVILTFQYSYMVSTYRADGVEGPAAGPVTH